MNNPSKDLSFVYNTGSIKTNFAIFVVAVPPDFKIENYLSISDSINLNNNNSSIDLLLRIIKVIRHQTIFKTVIHLYTTTAILNILKELGLVIDHILPSRPNGFIIINVLGPEIKENIIKCLKNIVTIEETHEIMG